MIKRIITICAVFLWCGSAFAAHPLITDDAGTLGAGNLQLELTGEYAKDSGDSATEMAAAVAGGLRDDLDIVLSVPYQFLRSTDDEGARVTEDGISDAALELKWRFYETEHCSLALKPGITFPTGDDDNGLGDGKAAYSAVFIATGSVDPVTLHMNLGYTKNRKELRNVWNYSLAAEYELGNDLLLVGNVGGETNSDKEAGTHPAFVLGGVIYNVNESLSVDLGIKAGLNKAEPDYAVLAGLTFAFGGNE